MRRRTRQFRVGLLVLASVTMFVGLVLFVLGSSVRSEARTYYILFEENVKGMVVGSKVNFQGVPIGAVADIRFRSGSTLVEISVDPQKAVIQNVTTARLDRLLVTGQVTIELEGFEPEAQELGEGTVIQARNNPISQLTTGLPDVVQEAHALLSETRTVLGKLDRLMSDDNLARVDRILEGLDEATRSVTRDTRLLLAELRDAAAGGRPLIDDVRAALRSITRSADHAAQWVDRERVDALLTTAEKTLVGLEAAEVSLVALGDEARALLGDNRNALRGLLTSAREALREVRGLARNLRIAPHSLLYGLQSEGGTTVPARPPRGGDR